MTFKVPPKDIIDRAVRLLSQDAKERIKKQYEKDCFLIELNEQKEKSKKITKSFDIFKGSDITNKSSDYKLVNEKNSLDYFKNSDLGKLTDIFIVFDKSSEGYSQKFTLDAPINTSQINITNYKRVA